MAERTEAMIWWDLEREGEWDRFIDLRNKSDEELPEELQELVRRALIEISGSTPAHIRDWTIADFVRGEPRGNTPKRDHPPYTLGQARAQE